MFDPYPYTWNAEAIRIEITPWAGMAHPVLDPWGGGGQVTFEGVALYHCGDFVALQQLTCARGFHLKSLVKIQMLKRGQWWDIPLAGRRRLKLRPKDF